VTAADLKEAEHDDEDTEDEEPKGTSVRKTASRQAQPLSCK